MFSKKVFMAETGAGMDRSDLLRLRGMGRRDFFTGAYAVILRRLPESESMAEDAADTDMEENEWRGSIIRGIASGNEYIVKGLYYENNVFSASAYGSRRTRMKRRAAEILYRLYRKSPEKLKKIEKKMASIAGLTGR